MTLNSEHLKELILSPDHETILLGILQFNIQNVDDEKTILSTINNLLSTAKTRTRGLELLNEILNYCSLTALTEHYSTWLNHCMVRYQDDNTKQLKLNVLTKIVTATTTHDVPGFNKQFTATHLSDTFKTCLAVSTPADTVAALHCLAQCMRRYGSWFGNHTDRLQPFLLAFLENSDGRVARAAAVAFHTSHQTGPAGVDAVNYTANFYGQYLRLCATVHTLYDQFFDGVNEIEHTETLPVQPFAFSVVPKHFDAQKVLVLTAEKIRNCLTYLEVMIRTHFPVAKKFVPRHLLDLINRGIAVHLCLSDKNITMELRCLSVLLGRIQTQLLRILRVLIVGYLPSLLPFSYFIVKLLINSLKRLQQCDCYSTDSLFRELTCKCLNDWIKLAKCGFQPQMQETLIRTLLPDIMPDKTTVVLLTTATNNAKKPSNKARRKSAVAHHEQNINHRPLYCIKKSIKEKNCIQSLTTLDHFLRNILLRVPNATILQSLYSFVIGTLLDIQCSRELAPYTNVQCQLALYRLLTAFYEQQNARQLPPIQIVTRILNVGLASMNRDVSFVCSQGLDLVEKIAQPVCPSLYLGEAVGSGATTSNHKDSLNMDAGIQSIDDEDDDDVMIEDRPDDHLPDQLIDVVQEKSKVHEIEEDDEVVLIDEDEDTNEDVVLMSNGHNKDDLVVMNGNEYRDKSIVVGNVDARTMLEEEPPIKKSKLTVEKSVVSDNDDLNDMLNSFQDVVQDSCK